MYNNDHIDQEDLRMRAILGNAQEEVPEHIWEGVAAGLDKAAMRKKTAAWLWRCVSGAAVAAAVVAGVVLHNGNEGDIVSATGEDMIAVVQEDAKIEDGGAEDLSVIPEASRLTAYAAKSYNSKTSTKAVAASTSGSVALAYETQTAQNNETEHSATEAATNVNQTDHTVTQQTDNEPAQVYAPSTTTQTFEDINWEEDDKPRKNVKASLVISGVAGTNTPQQNGGLAPLKGPAIFKSPTKTTVEQTSAESTYGIPVSFGAGAKLNLTKRWSLGMGLNYTLLSRRFNGKYTKVEDDIASLPVSGKVRNTQHYVGIPLNAYYEIVSKDFINLYAYAGGTAEKCVLCNYEVLTDPVINHREDVGGVQLSANAGIGVEFMLGQYVGLYLDPSLRYYFNCKQPKSIRTAQPLMLGFEMGLRFKL